MSDGVKVRIPANRTESGSDEYFWLSVDEAAELAGSIAQGIAHEWIRGQHPEEWGDFDLQRGMKQQAIQLIEEETFDAYGY